MQHQLAELAYTLNALTPILSQEALEYHYGKHHKAYVDKLNLLLNEPAHQFFQALSLDEIIQTASPGAVFNNAGQIWNHNFYWHCLTPERAKNTCDSALQTAIAQSFGSMEQFKTQFIQAALNQFGSGWAWLIKNQDGSLNIETTANAETPLQQRKTCLLTCDVWEHAYYIDYRNSRPQYLEKFWEIVNWSFVLENWQK